MYVLHARYVGTCGGVDFHHLFIRTAGVFTPVAATTVSVLNLFACALKLAAMLAASCLQLHVYLVLSFLHVHMQLLLHWEAGCLLVHMVARMTKRILSMLARVFLCSRPSLKVYKRVILRPLAKKMRSPPAIANMVCYTLYPVTARRKLLELHNENCSRCSERTPKAKEPKRDSTTENDSRQNCCRAIQTYEDTENI